MENSITLKDGPKDGEEALGSRHGLLPGRSLRKSPSNAYINVAWESPNGAYAQNVKVSDQKWLIQGFQTVGLMQPMAKSANVLEVDGSIRRVGRLMKKGAGGRRNSKVKRAG